MLLKKLPRKLNGVPITTDCKTWMRFAHIWESPLLNEEKIRLSFRLILGIEPFQENIDVGRWMQSFLWFYRCGEEQREVRQARERLLDWEKDSASIWADFKLYAGIDLDREKLHWWEFMALFESLPGDAGIKHKIELRALDLSKINDNDTRNQYAEAKALVALDPVDDDWW